jgi:putative nucleotidyltransferase with HDIG domain
MSSKPAIISIGHPLARRIGALADELGREVYVVGGYVRDVLLGLEDADLDIVVAGDGIPFAHAVAERLGCGPVVAYEKFGTAMIPWEGRKVEFVGTRTESYREDSRKPEVRAGTLLDDLRRRDFTVNAMAASLNAGRFGHLLDPLGGREDLEARLLRTPLDPEATFADDPLRMMRAARFASQLDFRIADAAVTAIRAMRDRLSIVSQERVTGEFLRLLRTRQPSVGLRLMYDTGLLDLVFPEVAQMAGVDQRRDHHHKDVFLHTLQVVDTLSRTTENVWLRFAALVHDIGKPRTKAYQEGAGWTFHGHEEVGARMLKRIFRRMRLPMDPLSYVEKLTRLHLRPMVLVDEAVTDSAVRRLVFEAGEDIEDLMALCRADITSKNPILVARYLGNYEMVMQKVADVIEKDRLRNWQPPVRGDEIMAVCGIPPGRRVGELKKAIEEAILDGRIQNDHDSALAYLLSIKDVIPGGNSPSGTVKE